MSFTLSKLTSNSSAINDGAAIFIGAKGQGKSTMTATLYGRGHQLITDDVAALTSQYEKLTQVSHQLSGEIYKGSSGSGGQGGPTGGGQEQASTSGKKDDDVIDADYKDVN